MIENIYLINLDKRPDRLESFINQSKNSQLLQKYQRISAIDGLLLSDDELKHSVTKQGYNDIISNKKAKGLYLTRGAVGLALTYKNLLEKCSGPTLFLEDDILIDNQFDSILYRTLNELPNDWDILYLGWYWSKHLIIENISSYISKISGQINGTQGWIINPIGAKKIIDMFPISYQIDTQIYKNNLLHKYCTPAPIVKRLNFKSDIQEN